ncbi:TonB-dependent receptor [Kineobactrum salinum]|uniref:TonB-dependent receptor n=1 Tax=Kineobactrum salinum TaxID=2708301 RepID=A0A6C0TWW8_9GAMM|nr:TonB-dependent receptor [Kineobactrum salinum]QIB64281.1 TonB-dependent receptor [Kineobactrum salinum]
MLDSSTTPSYRNSLDPRRRQALRKLTLAVAVAVAGTVGASSSALAQRVSGEVTDRSRTALFEGANVRIPELNMSTTTNDRGRFRLNDVPPGSYTLEIRYVGAPVRTIPVTVGPEGLELGEVVLGAGDSAEAYSLEEVLVTGQSAAMAGAINQQRAADHIKSVLDSDTMGQFPDQNVAESLRRLSGISVENDQGEGRYVVIRGMDPDLNSTSINGVRASATEDRRALQLDVIPTDVLDGVEVQKSLTPDMDGDAIGGSINVKTLSAFSRKELFVKGRVEGGYNELRGEWSPKASIAGSNIFDLANNRRLGVAAALSWHDRELGSSNHEADDWEMADNGNEYPETFEPRYYKINRERIGGALNLDYDLSDTTTIFARSLFSRLKDAESRLSQTYGDLSPLGDDAVGPDSVATEFAEIEMGTKDREQTADNLSMSFGSESQWERWGLKTNLGYSYAEEDTPNGVDSAWVGEFESGSGGIAAGDPVLTLNTRNNKKPVVESDYFDVLRDPGRYELDEIERSSGLVEDTQWALQFDATRLFASGELQFGAKMRLREKESNEDIELYGGDDVFTVADIYDPTAASDYDFPNRIDPMPSLGGVRDILAAGEGIEFDPIESQIASASNDWVVEEDVYAAYGMYTFETDRLVIVGGARVEYTDFASHGNSVELIEEGGLLDGVEVEDDTVVIDSISSDKSYTDVLPSVNLRYDISENVVGRLAVSRSIIRPQFEGVASRVSVEDNEAEIGNPDLEPYSSWNFDAYLEYYPSDISLISAGLFHKKIDDFIFTQVFNDFEFGGRVFDEATIARNGEEATVTGLEFNYQQQFGFLPSPFDGLLVSFNYTHVDGDAEFDGRDIPLPKQSDNIAGFVVGYDKYNLDLRFAVKYRDSYLDELVDDGLDRYTDEHMQIDFTAKYHVSDNWMLYAEFVNLNDEPAFYYAGNKRRVLQYDEFGRTTVIGLQFVY